MFRESAWLVAALALLPAVWALSAWADARRRRVAEALGREATLRRSADEGPERRVPRARLRLAAVALLLLALAGPRFGVELVETRADARQAVIAIDVSLSMTTPDVKPTRLERAKSSLSLLVDQLRGERVGVVAFAGEAQVICPLTQDADAAKQLLGALEPGAVPTPGSAVGAALRTASAMLARYPGGKAVILLTDGEDHKSDPLGAAKDAAAAGVKVYTIGIGTPEGEPIPSASGAYHKDAKGATVVSKLDESTLAAIARETGGEYYRTTPGSDEISEVARRVRELDAAKGLAGTANLWRDRYAWPAALAYVLLLLELLLPLLASVPAAPAAPAARAAAAAAPLALLLLAAPAGAATAEGRLREGNRLYGDKKYEEALERYGDAGTRRPKDARAPFNAGGALYRLERLEDAAAAFESVAARKDAPRALRADALYNLGNARFRGQDFAGAVKAYRGSLALAPADAEARHNLAVALLRLRRPPPPSKQDPKNEKDQPKSDDPDKKSDKSGGGGEGQPPPPQPPKTRPQDALTKDEAERILRAVDEREKQAQRQAREGKPSPSGKGATEEDW